MNDINFVIDSLMVPDGVEVWIDQLGKRPVAGDRSHDMARAAQDMVEGLNHIYVALDDQHNLMGSVSVVWTSEYPFFEQHNIPEIVDLYVAPQSRRSGVGKTLIENVIEQCRHKKYKGVGLTVEVTPDEFSPAHHFYADLGFVLDGQGLWHAGEQVKRGKNITISDKTLLGLVKWF